MFWFWWSDSHDWPFGTDRSGGMVRLSWSLGLAWGASLALLGLLIVLEPRVVELAFASALIAAGVTIAASALAAAWHGWRDRPRRIRVRTFA